LDQHKQSPTDTIHEIHPHSVDNGDEKTNNMIVVVGSLAIVQGLERLSKEIGVLREQHKLADEPDWIGRE
jgi:hypothetical protein